MTIHALLALDQRDEKLRQLILELTNQRDEARRELCKAESSGRIGRFGTAQEHAERMGWDCFKSDKQ